MQRLSDEQIQENRAAKLPRPRPMAAPCAADALVTAALVAKRAPLVHVAPTVDAARPETIPAPRPRAERARPERPAYSASVVYFAPDGGEAWRVDGASFGSLDDARREARDTLLGDGRLARAVIETPRYQETVTRAELVRGLAPIPNPPAARRVLCVARVSGKTRILHTHVSA